MLGQQLLFPSQKLLPQLRQRRYGLHLAQGQALLVRKILGLPLHPEQSAYQGHGLLRNLRRHLLGVNKLPARMRPAPSAGHLIARYHAVVSAIGIRQQYLLVISQKISWSLPPPVQGEIENIIGM